MKITIEHLEFPLSVKDKITKIPKISKLHLNFISGKNIHFDKTNLSIKEPHKIITLDKLFNLVLKMQYNLLEISKDTDSEIEFTKLYKYF